MDRDIVIFTNGNIFSRIILDKFLKMHKPKISLVVIVSGDYYGKKGLKAFFSYVKYTSWAYVLYKVLTIAIIKFVRIGNKSIISSVRQLCLKNGIPFRICVDVNDTSLFDQVKNSPPKYIISVSCPQMIRKKWLQMVDGKGLNIHGSLLPAYAGIAPYFWVLVNREKETGISVHYMTESFDKGDILSQERLDLSKGVSAFGLFLQLCRIGRDILPEAFDKMVGNYKGISQDKTSFSYYSHPTNRAYFKLKKNGFSLFNISDFSHLKRYLVGLNEIN